MIVFSQFFRHHSVPASQTEVLVSCFARVRVHLDHGIRGRVRDHRASAPGAMRTNEASAEWCECDQVVHWFTARGLNVMLLPSITTNTGPLGPLRCLTI